MAQDTSNTEEKSTKTAVVICIPDSAQPPATEKLTEHLASIPDTEMLKTQTIAAAVLQVQKAAKSVAIICITDKAELLAMMSLLESTASLTTAGTLRVIAINKLAHEKIPLMLKGKGCSEVLDFKVGKKEFNFKLNTYLKLAKQSYDRLVKTAELNGVDLSKDSKKSLHKIASDQSKDSKTQIVWEKPIDFTSDFWIVTHKKNIRNVLGSWLIQLLGPGPICGNWIKSKITLGEEQGWEWIISKQSKAQFEKDVGRWIFFGRQPEFSWEHQMWSFVSHRPTLAFYVDTEATHYRMLTENAQRLIINENSKQATALTSIIMQTIDSSIRFKDEKRAQSSEEELGSKSLGNLHEEAGDTPITSNEQLKTEDGLPWISGQDGFISIKLELFVKAKNQIPTQPPIAVELIEVEGENIILDIPADAIQLGERLSIDLKLTEGEKSNQTSIEAVADHFQNQAEDGRIMLLACTTDETTRKKVQDVLNIYLQKQQFLINFLNAAKG